MKLVKMPNVCFLPVTEMTSQILDVFGSSVTIAVSRRIVPSTLGSPLKLVFSSIVLTNPDMIHLSN